MHTSIPYAYCQLVSKAGLGTSLTYMCKSNKNGFNGISEFIAAHNYIINPPCSVPSQPSTLTASSSPAPIIGQQTTINHSNNTYTKMKK